MKNKKLLLVIILPFVAVICILLAVIKMYGPNFGFYLVPPSVTEYVNIALNRMNNGIYANGEEWEKAKKNALNKAKSAKSYEETHDILDEAAGIAGGKHSALIDSQSQDSSVESQQMPECEMKNDILYIKLPAYDMQSGKSKEYTDTVISSIKENMNDCKGIILNIRDNTGGDMGPMVAAVAPLLPDGTLMSFDIRGSRLNVELKKGTVTGGGSTTTVEDFKAPQVKVAILQNEWTASSGEAALLCFKGLSNVKTFGTDSAGYCSSNTIISLYDGAYIQLTIGKDIDRLGNEYCEDPIAADVETDNPQEDAIKWINE